MKSLWLSWVLILPGFHERKKTRTHRNLPKKRHGNAHFIILALRHRKSTNGYSILIFKLGKKIRKNVNSSQNDIRKKAVKMQEFPNLPWRVISCTFFYKQPTCWGLTLRSRTKPKQLLSNWLDWKFVKLSNWSLNLWSLFFSNK